MPDDAPMHILIVDDQAAMRATLEVLFETADLPTLSASTPEQALLLVREENVGLVIQDMNFADGETSGDGGIRLFRALRALDAELPILLMTTWTSLETAVMLMREGATDYFAKPWDDDKLVAQVKTLLQLRQLARDNTRLSSRSRLARRALAARHDLAGLVYASDTMHELVSLAVKIAPSDAPVLITGPNGAGKDRLASLIQRGSRRQDRPFVQVNAGALTETLLDAELFGAEAGAYTGATKLRIGRFEAAHGGTLFLDELGNLSLSGQMKLLRILETGQFQRVGSSTTRHVDVRLISATNADLPSMITAGSFREDLYYRLNVIELAVPPLVDRPDDILPLAEHFLSQLGSGGPQLKLLAAAANALRQHDWPGNVRELSNRLQRASLICNNHHIDVADLALPTSTSADRAPHPAFTAPTSTPPTAALSADDEQNRAQIQLALVTAQGVVSKAAAELGLSRQALYRRMERLGLTVERQVHGEKLPSNRPPTPKKY